MTETNVSEKNTAPLSEGKIDTEYKVISNPKLKYIEMGLYHDSIVRIIKNNDCDRNLVIAVGDARYIISKNIAKTIMVSDCSD